MSKQGDIVMGEVGKLINATTDFYKRMLYKLIKKYFCDGYFGWDESENIGIMEEEIYRQIKKRDWIDVANYAMMLDYYDSRS